MNRLQSSPAGKILAWVLLLTLSFFGAQFGLRALTVLPYLGMDSWQSGSPFRNLVRAREIQLTEYFADQESLRQEGLNYMQLQQLEDNISAIERSMLPSATAFRFQVRTADGSQVLYSNLSDEEVLSQTVEKVYYAIFSSGDTAVAEGDWWDQTYYISGYTLYNSFDGGIYGSVPTQAVENAQDAVISEAAPSYVIECGVPAEIPENLDDEFSQLYHQTMSARLNLSPRVISTIVCAVLALVCLGYALWTAGHKSGSPEIVLTWQDKIFFDLYLLVMMGAGTALFAVCLYLGDALYSIYYSSELGLAEQDLLLSGISLAAAAFVGVAALTLRTLAVRGKARALARTTLVCRVLGWCWRVVRDFVWNLPLTWRLVAGFLAYILAGILFRGMWGFYNPIPTFLLNLAVLLGLCWWTACFRRLRQGSQTIAAGNLSHQIDTARMPHDLRAHAEDLNNISVGLSSAVDEKMKSERFKAELITNVSHDLKTPLTSIINYVNLLKTTQQTDPKALEYIEVLDRKSQRLKKLTEDLVEASKASTGVLSVNREKIGMAQLIDQAMGEWMEKLEERKLTIVTSLPEGETWVYADGRHLWRVIDNLLSNCAKYAMEGTRVYLDLSRGHGQVTLSVKNISRDALNVPPDRLMERFVRGEESRSTEGSGLGLSIARSLTELQGGTFDLTVDGDLFKATVSLPQAN